MSSSLKIGIAGLGTVGSGLVSLIMERKKNLEIRAGRAIEIVAISARNKKADRGFEISSFNWHDNPLELANDQNIDVVVELIGGSEGIAKDLVLTAIENGKHVITANKALVAHYGTLIANAAEISGVSFSYEAAVAGGIPIIKSLREGLAGNALNRVYGVLNGTCNYILTTMEEQGREFDDILAECQKLGYAETDPRFDIDGIDTAHKLAILASVAFGGEVNFKAVHVEGIRHISPIDMQFAEELGFRIKLLGIASNQDGRLEQRVHPCMIPIGNPIAKVTGSTNAVVADGNFVGTIVQEGSGAGAGPTASAVTSDIIDIARGLSVPVFGVPVKQLKSLPSIPMQNHSGAYYIRLMLLDKPGVFADIAAALRDHEVSMESVLQRTRDPGEPVPVVLTMHETIESSMTSALEKIAAIGAVVEPPRMIRIEPL
jgi:homoserine dehydrogenase